MISILLNLRYVLWPRIQSTLVNVPHAFENIVFSVVVRWVFYKCQLGQLIHGVVQVYDTLTDFLLTCFINCWEKKFEISDYNCGFVYIFLQCYHFCLMHLKLCLVGFTFSIVLLSWRIYPKKSVKQNKILFYLPLLYVSASFNGYKCVLTHMYYLLR